MSSPPSRALTPIAANLRAELARTGLSAAEVARRLGVHERLVRRWRNAGESDPSWANMLELAALFGRDAGWFYKQRTESQLARIAAGKEPTQEAA